MAAALMTQWLFNFVIAKVSLTHAQPIYKSTTTNRPQQLTPIMLARITYGTFLVFGSACIVMVVYAVLCVPETKGVPLESIYMLFEGNIIAGATRDVVPRFSRAKHLANSSNEGRYRDDEGEDDEEEEAGMGKDGGKSSHIERAGPAKQSAYGMNAAGAS